VEILLLVVGLMLAAVVLVGVGDRLRLPWPALMVVLGAGVAFVPGLPDSFELEPDLILPLFLPPVAVRDGAAHVVGGVPGPLAHDRVPRGGPVGGHGRRRRRDGGGARPGAERHGRDRARRDGRPARPGRGGGGGRSGADAAAAAHGAAERGAVQRRHAW
jgi:hypothetical protein